MADQLQNGTVLTCLLFSMRHWRLMMLALLLVTAHATARAQDDGRPTLDQLMSPAIQKAIGVHKLTPAERDRLRDYMQAFARVAYEDGRRSAGREPAGYSESTPMPRGLADTPSRSVVVDTAVPSEGTPMPRGAVAARTPQTAIPRAIQASPAQSRAIYAGPPDGHWIRRNIERGAFILLEDGSLWETDPLERLNASLWLPSSQIMILPSARGMPGYNHVLINTDDREKAHAKYVGKQ